MFGGFGAKPATTSAFGGGLGASGTTSTFGQPATGTSAFGQTPAPAFGGFGQANTQQQAKPSLFGNLGGNTATTTQPAFGGFGQTPAAQPAQPAPFSFGSTAPAQPATSAFGQPAAKPAFSFGQTAPAENKPAFGGFGTTTTTQPATTSLFGQPAQQQPAGGLFGGGSAFGQNNTAAAKPLFGSTAPGTSLFGNTQTQQPGQQAAAPAPLFSFGQNNTANTATTSAPAFGFGQTQPQQQQQQQPQQQAGGLFGNLGGGSSLFGGQNTQQQPTNSLFGGSNLGSTFGGLGQTQNSQFGQSQQQQQPLQPIQASIDQNPYGNNPIFANIQPAQTSGLQQAAPAAGLNDSSKKQLPLFASLAYKNTPRSAARITKLRGFATSTASPAASNGRFGSPSINGTPSRGSTTMTITNGAATPDGHLTLSPQAFTTRQSVKKLVIDSKSRALSRPGTPSASAQNSNAVTASGGARFDPNAEVADRSVSRSRTPQAQAATPASAVIERAGSAQQGSRLRNSENGQDDSRNAPLTDGDYFTKPSLKALRAMSKKDLSDVIDLEVGRQGYGSIQWQEPVDLSELSSVRELLGGVVVIEDREVMVYSGKYEEDKPEVGKGLNVPATVTLYKCWPLDKATREPIKSADHARTRQLINKLRKKAETTFVDYVAESGAWIFNVEHFSRYVSDALRAE